VIDRQRSEVYAAELAAFDGTDLEVVRPLGDVVTLIHTVVAGEWWPGPTVTAVAMRADARSSCARTVPGGVEVRLATPQATWATAAHELAHALAGVDAGHDALYRRAMLDVVEVVTNTATGARRGLLHVEQLAGAYRAAGLDVADRTWPRPDAGGPIAL
jgi:hypothetical protein